VRCFDDRAGQKEAGERLQAPGAADVVVELLATTRSKTSVLAVRRDVRVSERERERERVSGGGQSKDEREHEDCQRMLRVK
jgi:hypothetical protein